MNKSNWISPKLVKYQRENIEILSLKNGTGAETALNSSGLAS